MNRLFEATYRRLAAGRTAQLNFAALSVVAFLLASSCGPKHPEYEGAVYSFEDFAFYPDSIFFKPDGESATRLFVAPDSLPQSEGVGLYGSDRLVNYLFAKGARARASVSDSALIPYGIFVTDALLRPAEARAELMGWLDGQRPSASARYQWPVLAAPVEWAIAAREIYYATGRDDWRDADVDRLMQTLRRDRYLTFDKTLGIFRGATPELIDCFSDTLMDAARWAMVSPLSVNIDRAVAYDYIAELQPPAVELRDSLVAAIEVSFWDAARGRFGLMLYQWPYPVQLPAADNLIQSMASASGIVYGPAVEALVRKMPVGAMEVYPVYPLPEKWQISQARSDLTTAYRAIAAARAGNSAAFNHAYSLLAERVMESGNDDECAALMCGVTLRTLLGLRPALNSLEIRPFVPAEFGLERQLKNFVYRDAILDITVTGQGDVISTAMLDGQLLPAPVIPADLAGRHEVKIVLAGFSNRPSGIKICKPEILPTASPVSVDKGEAKLGGYDAYNVYVNGELTQRFAGDVYPLPDVPEAAFYTFEPIARDSVAGLAAPEVMTVSPMLVTRVAAEKIARPGSRMFSKVDKKKGNKTKLGDKMIESSLYKNPDLRFVYNAPEAGRYYVSLVYLKGLGIVNPGRRYAIRLLQCNEVTRGLMVLPQLSPDDWSPSTPWWEFRGKSLPMPVDLNEGNNSLSISYLAPSEAGFSDDANIIIPLSIEIAR